MRKLLIVLFAIFICQAVTAQDQDVSVSLEITNISNKYFGTTGAAFIMIPGERGGSESPRLMKRVDTSTLSGIIKNNDETDFKLSDARLGAGYVVILIFIKAGEADLTMYSKQFVITSDKVKLNFRSDFSPDPRRALSR
jgi:hypothetical protein